MNKGITAVHGPDADYPRASDRLCTPNIMQSSACDESQAHNGARGPVSARNDFFTDSQAIALFTCPALCRVINKSRCSVKLGRTYRGRPPRCRDETPLDVPFTAVVLDGRKCLSKNTDAVYIVYIVLYCIHTVRVCVLVGKIYVLHEGAGQKSCCMAN